MLLRVDNLAEPYQNFDGAANSVGAGIAGALKSSC